jgi:CMP-N-acetylneuraminic acid synthetase
VFQHALDWLAENESYQPEIVVQLRPTSPFRRVWHIDQAVYRLLENPQADSVRSVCIPFQNPFKMWRINPDGTMRPLLDNISVASKHIATASLSGSPGSSLEPYNLPRQALPEVYWQTGYVDAAWADTIRNKNSMTGEYILPLIIEPSEWIDIDAPEDWRRAERLLESGEITFDDLGFEVIKL